MRMRERSEDLASLVVDIPLGASGLRVTGFRVYDIGPRQGHVQFPRSQYGYLSRAVCTPQVHHNFVSSSQSVTLLFKPCKDTKI